MRWKNLLYYTLSSNCQLRLCLYNEILCTWCNLHIKETTTLVSWSSSDIFMLMLWQMDTTVVCKLSISSFHLHCCCRHVKPFPTCLFMMAIRMKTRRSIRSVPYYVLDPPKRKLNRTLLLFSSAYLKEPIIVLVCERKMCIMQRKLFLNPCCQYYFQMSPLLLLIDSSHTPLRSGLESRPVYFGSIVEMWPWDRFSFEIFRFNP
jgi:hypothetical protein